MTNLDKILGMTQTLSTLQVALNHLDKTLDIARIASAPQLALANLDKTLDMTRIASAQQLALANLDKAFDISRLSSALQTATLETNSLRVACQATSTFQQALSSAKNLHSIFDAVSTFNKISSTSNKLNAIAQETSVFDKILSKANTLDSFIILANETLECIVSSDKNKGFDLQQFGVKNRAKNIHKKRKISIIKANKIIYHKQVIYSEANSQNTVFSSPNSLDKADVGILLSCFSPMLVNPSLAPLIEFIYFCLLLRWLYIKYGSIIRNRKKKKALKKTLKNVLL